MPQKFINTITSTTTTTSFIVSSDESLNKPPLSSGQSTDSVSDNMTTSDSIPSNQYSGAVLNNNTSSMIVNHQANTGLSQASMRPPNAILPPPPLPPPPPPPASSNESFYGTLNGPYESGALQTTTQPVIVSHRTSSSFNQSNGHQDNASMIYGSFSQNNAQHSPSNVISIQTSIYDRASVPNTTYSSNLGSPNIHSFHNNQKQSPNNQRSSTSSLESAASTQLMPINVQAMLLHGVSSDEVLRMWLMSIKCDEYLENFSNHGYDMFLVTRMTPQDLAAIGCKSPSLRKKLLLEIKKLNLEDEIPNFKPSNLAEWLELLKLNQYHHNLCSEGLDTIDKVCELTWEDLEEIGITKLGHQKRLLIGIERVKKLLKQQEERQNDSHNIYDVHPNHRISLNGANSTSTLGRVRSGLFQTRSGAHLDHRGLPIATVMPALKHVNSSMVNSDTTQQILGLANDCAKTNTQQTTNAFNGNNSFSTTSEQKTTQTGYNQQNYTNNNIHEIHPTLKMSELTATLKRNPPPLPPVRTNSLKLPQGSMDQQNNNPAAINGHHQPIYGNNYTIVSDQTTTTTSATPITTTNNKTNNGAIYLPSATNSTSFLRTAKLGTLTPTTNKMLTVGSHIQSTNCNGQTTHTVARSVVPIREAPLPPVQISAASAHPPVNALAIPEKIDEEPLATAAGAVEAPLPNHCQPSSHYDISTNSTLMGASSLIGHQLASADEFPPPPPCQ